MRYLFRVVESNSYTPEGISSQVQSPLLQTKKTNPPQVLVGGSIWFLILAKVLESGVDTAEAIKANSKYYAPNAFASGAHPLSLEHSSLLIVLPMLYGAVGVFMMCFLFLGLLHVAESCITPLGPSILSVQVTSMIKVALSGSFAIAEGDPLLDDDEDAEATFLLPCDASPFPVGGDAKHCLAPPPAGRRVDEEELVEPDEMELEVNETRM